MKNKKIIISILILLTIVLAFIIAHKALEKKEPVSKSEYALNTQCSIEIRDMDKDTAENIIDEAFQLCRDYEALLSKTVPGSDIDKINKSKGSPTPINDETLKLIKYTLQLSKESNGMYDITLGKVSDLWDFNGDNPRVPEDKEIKKALKAVNYKNISIDNNRITLADKDTWVDLGSIAKGYIGDKVYDYLISSGVKSGIINLGGNIITIGTKENGESWRIGVEVPYSNRSDVAATIPMESGTLVTAGIYERYVEKHGKKYHHILNPYTGYPVDSDLLAVSIYGKSGTSFMCDSISTTSLLLGKEKAMKFFKKYEDDFGMILIDNENKITTMGNLPKGTEK